MAQDVASLLAGLAPIWVEGRFWRHSSPRYPVLAGSPTGGRWSPPGLIALYLARPRECCVAEAYRTLVDGREGMRPELVGSRRLSTLRVAVTRVRPDLGCKP